MRNLIAMITLIVSFGFAGETNGFAEVTFGIHKDSACKIMSPPKPDSLERLKNPDSISTKWLDQMAKYDVLGCDGSDQISSDIYQIYTDLIILWKFKGIEGPSRRGVFFSFTQDGVFYEYLIKFYQRDSIKKIKNLFSKKYGRSFKLKKKESERNEFGIELGYQHTYVITGPKTIVTMEIFVNLLAPRKSGTTIIVTSKKIQKKLDLIKRKKKNTGKDF